MSKITYLKTNRKNSINQFSSDELIGLVKCHMPGNYSQPCIKGIKAHFATILGEDDIFNPYQPGCSDHEAFLYGMMLGKFAIQLFKANSLI